MQTCECNRLPTSSFSSTATCKHTLVVMRFECPAACLTSASVRPIRVCFWHATSGTRELPVCSTRSAFQAVHAVDLELPLRDLLRGCHACVVSGHNPQIDGRTTQTRCIALTLAQTNCRSVLGDVFKLLIGQKQNVASLFLLKVRRYNAPNSEI